MGDRTFSDVSYQKATNQHISKNSSATKRGEDEVRNTGKLNPLVDPAEYGVIRRSLPRFEQTKSGLYRMTIGTPMCVETRLDSTGSMGNNVEIALSVLPSTYGLCNKVLPDYDLQIAIGIFADCEDKFVLCRPQFEMHAEKIVDQLTLMMPESNGGGNGGEDPQYGLFGGAYLTSAYINRIGLKRYDFTISDEPARNILSSNQLKRIFGKEVFQRLAENGFKEITPENIPTTKELIQDLLKQAHAFFLEVEGWGPGAHEFWIDVFGPDRVVILPNIKLLPQVQAVIIGLTEGTLSLGDVEDFLINNGVDNNNAKKIIKSVSNIPIGAQLTLKQDKNIPKAGDFFKEKTDVWPLDPSQITEQDYEKTEQESAPNWL